MERRLLFKSSEFDEAVFKAHRVRTRLRLSALLFVLWQNKLCPGRKRACLVDSERLRGPRDLEPKLRKLFQELGGWRELLGRDLRERSDDLSGIMCNQRLKQRSLPSELQSPAGIFLQPVLIANQPPHERNIYPHATAVKPERLQRLLPILPNHLQWNRRWR